MVNEIWRQLPTSVRQPVREIIFKLVAHNKFLNHKVNVGSFIAMTPDTPPAVRVCLEKAHLVGVQGDYYEFGLYRGYTFWFAQQSAQSLGLNLMRFFGFDSFQGLPKPEGIDAETGEFSENDYAASIDEVKYYLERYGVDWKKTFLVKGFYDDSLKPELKTNFEMNKVMVALIDCDLYHSTTMVLNFLGGLLQDGSVLMFDDWNCFNQSDEKGERRAFREFLEKHSSWRADPFISFGWHGQSFVLSHV